MFKGKRISVVFSTYNEKESIRQHINDLLDTGIVDEVIAVNNNAVDGTEEEINKTKAKQFFEKRQGYGWGYRRALKEATGDIIIMTEPDGTFVVKDIKKFLLYSETFDVIFGTRTTSATILKNANMGLFLKWGNWFIAKMIEILFNTTHLSDVGCTMKLIKRNALDKIQKYFTVGSSHFGPEFMLLVILKKIPFVEIPIHYGPRIGASSVTGSRWKAFVLGLIMIFLVLKYRLLGIKK